MIPVNKDRLFEVLDCCGECGLLLDDVWGSVHGSGKEVDIEWSLARAKELASDISRLLSLITDEE